VVAYPVAAQSHIQPAALETENETPPSAVFSADTSSRKAVEIACAEGQADAAVDPGAACRVPAEEPLEEVGELSLGDGRPTVVDFQ
jgi:hypothetical protein